MIENLIVGVSKEDKECLLQDQGWAAFERTKGLDVKSEKGKERAA